MIEPAPSRAVARLGHRSDPSSRPTGTPSTEPVAAAVVGLDEHADRVAAAAADHARGGADAALEAVADHAGAAADVALGDRAPAAASSAATTCSGSDVLAVDVVERPSQVSPTTGRRPADLVRHGRADARRRSARRARRPRCACWSGRSARSAGRPRAPIRARSSRRCRSAGGSRRRPARGRVALVRQDDGDAGADRALPDHERTVPSMSVAWPDAHPGDVGDGVEGAAGSCPMRMPSSCAFIGGDDRMRDRAWGRLQQPQARRVAATNSSVSAFFGT